MTPLAITGLGLLSSVGHDVVTACAAIRCGMTRPAPVEFEVPSDEGPGNIALTGHPLSGITDGFQGIGRYLRMTTQAVGDLLRFSALEGQGADFWSRTALHIGLSRTRNEEIDFYDDILEEQLAGELARQARLAIPAERRHTLFGGHASALLALREAATAIERGACERALIVCVDSLLESDVLAFLYAEDRLKTPVKPRGLAPGEAAAAFLVEPVAAARRRKATLHAIVEGVEVGREPVGRVAGARSGGVALSEVIARLVARGQRVGTIMGDLNGEDARAREWGNALVRLAGHPTLSGTPQQWPAVSLGDTGAASGAVAVVAGARALQRGYAGGPVLVWSSADSGDVAAALLRAEEVGADR